MIHDIVVLPDGISTGETGKLYDIGQRVVLKYIRVLEDAGLPIYSEHNLYFLDESYFASFTLTVDRLARRWLVSILLNPFGRLQVDGEEIASHLNADCCCELMKPCWRRLLQQGRAY